MCAVSFSDANVGRRDFKGIQCGAGIALGMLGDELQRFFICCESLGAYPSFLIV
jgi:hypothetical protein